MFPFLQSMGFDSFGAITGGTDTIGFKAPAEACGFSVHIFTIAAMQTFFF
jgi:hypothetical protein